MDDVTRATPFSGMVGRPKANTWYSLQALNIWRLYFQPLQRYFRWWENL